MQTIADLLPPKVRVWTYAILVALNGGYVVAEAAYEMPTPVLIGLGVLNGAGFVLASANVNVSVETP